MTYLGEVSGKIYQETSFTGKGSIPGSGSGSVTQMATGMRLTAYASFIFQPVYPVA